METIKTSATENRQFRKHQLLVGQEIHSPVTIEQPHRAIYGQPIKARKKELKKFGVNEIDYTNNFLKNDYGTWFDFIGLVRGSKLVDDSLIYSFVDAQPNSNHQELALRKIHQCAIEGLNAKFSTIQMSILNALNTKGIVSNEKLLKWGGDQFAYEIAFDNKKEDGVESEDLALRLVSRTGLSVLWIDCVNHVPPSLRRICFSLIRFLCDMGNKLNSADLCHCYGAMGFMAEFVECFETKDMKNFCVFIEGNKHKKALNYLSKKDKESLDELKEYHGCDDEEFARIIYDHFSHILSFDEYHSVEKEETEFRGQLLIKRLQDKMQHMETTKDPSIGHPVYAHMVSLLTVMENFYEHVTETSLFECDSDSFFQEYKVISFNNNDEMVLNDHNENLCSMSENGYAIASMKHPKDLMNTLSNMILSDCILLHFDL